MRACSGVTFRRWFAVVALLALLLVPTMGVGAAVTQVQKITPGDGGANDGFGYAVAVSPDGSTAVIGAYRKTASTGAIYIYTRAAGGTWTLKQEITSVTAAAGIDPLAANDDFGFAVAIDNTGATIIVGAPAINSGVRGKAYIFTTANHTTWSVQEELKPTGVGISDQFGYSVALSGAATTALVGAHFVSKVYVFAGSPLNTTPVNILVGAPSTDFGWSVALNQSATPAVDGTTAIVGAISDQSGTGGGAAYAYTGGSPFSGAAQKLQPSVSGGAPGGPAFGNAVALSGDGNTALVGAPYDTTMSPTNPSGSAFAYFKSGGTFSTATVQRIDPTDTVPPDFTGGYFGTNVALSGDGGVAVVSETEGSTTLTNPTTNPGSVSVYRKSGATFDTANKQTLFASDPVDQDFFGSGLGLPRDGLSLLVGAQDVHPPSGPGAAYAFTTSPDLAPPGGALPAGTVGTMYTEQFTGSNGAGGPYTYAVTGTLPPGLTLAANTGPTPGVLSGTPTQAGDYSFSIGVTDPSGTTTHLYTLHINPGATTIQVANATASFSAAPQNVALTATVTASVPVNEGTVIITVMNGATLIGSSPATAVTGGQVTANVPLPAGTPAGSYAITAAYTPSATTPNFTASTTTIAGTLTISGAAAQPTTTTVSSAAAFVEPTDRSVTLSATVAATTPVNEGTVTFAVTQGATPLNAAVTSGPVTNGQASALFVVPANSAPGSYTITATYNPAATNPQFTTSNGTGTLTVTTATVTSITLSAGPASGTIKVGQTVQFTLTGTLSDGSSVNLTNQASWVSDHGEIITVVNGLVTGKSPGGPVTITVTYNGMSKQVVLSVSAPTPVGITVPVQPAPAGRPSGTTGSPVPSAPGNAPAPLPASR